MAGKERVTFCASNLALGHTRIVETLKERHPELGVNVYGCLGNCQGCEGTPYAVVDGHIVMGADAQELLARIEARLARR